MTETETETEPEHGAMIGRWTYNGESTRYGEAGWHLDNGPIVLDWMPACDDGCEPDAWGDEHYDCCYVLYGWPGNTGGTMVDKWLPAAMDQIEREWDEREMPDAYRERPSPLVAANSEARCFGCRHMFQPWTNEWFCSDACRDAYPEKWPKVRYP